MTPQAHTVLTHLRNHGSLTPVEAATVYRIRHLPSKVFELKTAGYQVRTTLKNDAMGQRYARYTLAPIPSSIIP
jgi:hypothetical protein